MSAYQVDLLASSVDLELVDQATKDWMNRYGVDATRFGPAADPAVDRDRRHAGHHAPATGAAETVLQPAKIDNDLYMRDYSNCILCYKCVEACGEDAQNTFAISVAGRGFDARVISLARKLGYGANDSHAGESPFLEL